MLEIFPATRILYSRVILAVFSFFSGSRRGRGPREEAQAQRRQQPTKRSTNTAHYLSELKQSEARRERERKVRHGSLDAGKAEPWLWRRPWTRARACASRLPCSGVRMWPRWRPGRRRDGDRRAFARSLPSSPLSARSTGPVGAPPAPPGPPAGPARAPPKTSPKRRDFGWIIGSDVFFSFCFFFSLRLGRPTET